MGENAYTLFYFMYELSMGLVGGTSGYNLMSSWLAGGSTVRLEFGGFHNFGYTRLGILGSNEISVPLNCFSFFIFMHL